MNIIFILAAIAFVVGVLYILRRNRPAVIKEVKRDLGTTIQVKNRIQRRKKRAITALQKVKNELQKELPVAERKAGNTTTKVMANAKGIEALTQREAMKAHKTQEKEMKQREERIKYGVERFNVSTGKQI